MEDTPKKDKMMNTAPVKKELGTEYHFAGGGKYKPTTITATSQDEAQKKWLETRTLEVVETAKVESAPAKEE